MHRRFSFFARVENCQIGQNCQSGQKFLLIMVGGKRLVGCGQISLASNSKANGLNEVTVMVQVVVMNKLILLRDVP